MLAAVDADGVAGRQGTGVFAGEPASSGWTQLLDSVNTYPPLAHQGLRPTLQNQPPPTLRRQATEQQQQQQQQQQESLPLNLPAEANHPQTDTHDFQYDSFSDSHEDRDVQDEPELESVLAQQLHTDSEAAPQPQPEQQQQSSGHIGGLTDHEPNAGPQQQQQHSGIADVIPQMDGAADFDSLDSASPSTSGQQVSQRPATQPGHRDVLKPPQQTSNLAHVPPLADTVSSAPTDSALPNNMSATNSAQLPPPPLSSAAVPNPRHRRRRSRHVVQHAVLLAAAARTAMVAAGSPEQEDNAQRVPPAGFQSEPQLPSWSLPPVPPHRHFQSEPQLLEHAAAHHPGMDVRGMHRCTEDPGHHTKHVHQSSSQVAIIGQQQSSAVSHQPSQSTVAGPPVQALMSSQIISDSRATSDWLWRNRQQQSQAAPSQPLHANMFASQVVSDSRATSDRRWAQGSPQLLHPGVQPSQLVSDSRATSDLAWAQRLQAQQQAPAPQPLHPSLQLNSQPAAQNGRASTELAWEQDLVEPATSSHDHQVSEPAGTAGKPDDLEIVISDSQPSPPDALDPRKDSPPSAGPPRQLAGAASTLVGHALNQKDWSAAQPTSVAQEHSKAHPADPAASHTQDQPVASLAVDQYEHPVSAAARQPAVALTVAETPAPGQNSHIPDQELHHMPTFSNRLNASGTPSAAEALTPVMMPRAQAHIQAQHGATPSLLVIKDTPQSAAVVTPRTSVKDTPRDQTMLPHRLLPPRFSLQSDQAATPYITPLPFGAGSSTAGSEPPAMHSSPGSASRHDADHSSQLSQPQALHLQCQEVLPVPELTLRLSLSDGSLTRSAKAGQISPGTDPRPSHTHASSQLGHVTASLQLPTSQRVNAHDPSQSAAIPSEGKSLHLLNSGSPPSADKPPSFTANLGRSALQLQAEQAGGSHARQIASEGLPAPQFGPATAAVEAVTGRAGQSLPVEPAKYDYARSGHVAGVGTESPDRDSFASKPSMQAVEQSSDIICAAGGQTNQDLSDGNLNAEDAGVDHASDQEPQDPSEKSEDHDAAGPEGQHDDASRTPNPSGSPPDDGMAEPDEHDLEYEDDDQPDDPDPDGGSRDYSLTDDLVPHRYKQRAPTKVLLCSSSCTLQCCA